MGTVHKHSRSYSVADCVADNFTWVCDGWCLLLQCTRGCRQYSWRTGPQHTSPTPTPRPCLGKGLLLWMPLPLSPSPLRYRSTPISGTFFLLFLQLFDLGTLRLAMHEAVKALQRLLPGSAVDLWFTLTIAEPGLNGESQSVRSWA